MIDKLLLGLFSGIAFGFVIQRSGATDPDRMTRSHLMIDANIPQFMLATVALSAVGLFGLQTAGIGHTVILPISLVATGLAAAIFGIGWGLCGYCPGTTWAAVGEGRLDAVFALVGGMAGAAVFAHLHERLIPLLYDPTNMGRLTVPDLIGNHFLALVIVLFIICIIIYLIGRIWKNDSTTD
ncbi:MAG: YeeE/YedE family protein [Desulfobacterales bacterium]|nr:YeeE/YedE family protein [Desulfobacterales bacterium]